MKMKGHKGHHHKKHKATGGKIEVEGIKAGEGGGDPFVEKEAEEKKHGGKVKRKHGGHVDGKKPHHRMDRKRGGKVSTHHVEGRKSGGRVGSDKSPLSSAHNMSSPESLPKTQEGGLSK